MSKAVQFGFNVISHVSGNLGIGVTARNVLRVLLERGYPVSVLDIDPGMGRHGHDRSYDAYTVDSLRDMPYGINLFILPPPTISHLLPQVLINKPGCLNVAWSMWELPVLPEAWSRPLEMLDVLIAQSEFIRYAFEFNLSHVQTIAAVHPLYLPGGIRADRARFGLPPDGVIFLTSFDPCSDPQRKNPFAAIRAFLAELGNDTNAHLVIKLNNAQSSGQMHPVLEQLMELCAGHPQVRLLTESMSYSDVLDLYASCDVFVSLHRAEGLGLGPMEAMALGKVVIATGWSGNMTYMNHNNACPVGYRLIPVEASIVEYSNQSLRKEALWADPDVQQAAAWMRRLMDDPALRVSLGARARDDIARHHARAREGAFIDELRAIWEHQLQLASVNTDACPGASQDVVRQRSERLTDYLRWYAVQGTASFDDMYQSWISRHATNEEAVLRYRERMRQWRETPVVHVIIDLQPGQESRLADTIDSLAGQLLDNWRLSVIAGQPAPNELFNELDILRWELVPEGGDRGAAINKVAAEVAADWVSLGMAGDRYATMFSFTLADHVNCHPQLGFIYSDDDCITADGKHIDVRFKPDFNLDLLRSMPYMGECCMLRRDLLRELGGYAPSPDARNYDIALRVLDVVGEAAIGHIADVLYHRCAADAETAANEGRIEQCRLALISHLQRNGIEAEVQHGLLPGSYFVDYRHAVQPLVSIIVPTHDRADLLNMCIASLLEKTDYPNYEILVIDNNTTQPAALELLDSYADIPRVRVLRHPGEYNFAAINNHAVHEARGEYLLLLNNDTVVLHANWLTRLMAHGQRPEVGIVGARLVYPDQRLQHAGIVLGMGGSGVAEHPFMGLPMTDAGYMGRAQVVQNYAGVTAACLLIRKSLYGTVGGMDEHCFKVFYNDVDLCLKVGEQGFKIVWTPFVTLIHHGSASLKATAEKPEKIARARSEAFAMYERWLPTLANDAAYNRNLSLVHSDPRPDIDFIVPWRDTDRALPRIAGFMLGSEGSWLYRVGSPLGVLDRERRADCAVMTRYEDRVRVPTVAELARIDPDIMLLHNTVHDSHLSMLELYKKFNRAFRVFGADDLMFALHGKNPFQKTVFRDMKKRIRTCLSLCDRLVVTTVPLAEAYRGMIDDIRVVPNYLDSARWGHLQSLRRQGDKPRVGWAGATQHQGDLELIIDAVKETAKEVDWVFLGMCPEEIRPYVSEFHKGVPLEAYPEKLASLNLDLAVAPLEYHRFNEAKSNLRILEYGVLGWPVICSNIYPYQDAPVERVSNNPRAWINAIRARIHDLDAAAAEGDRLRDWVLSDWMLEDHLDVWLAALDPRTDIIGAVHGGKPQRASG